MGRVIAQRLGVAGFNVALHYHDGEAEALAVVAEIQARGQTAMALRGDLTEDGIPADIVSQAIEGLGGVDLVVNNAGVTFVTPFADLSAAEVDHCYRINFLAPLWLAQTAARWMIHEQRPGNIIQITSVHQERVTDRDNIYGSMKAALARLTESLAYELGPHHIRVNAIAPGRMDTPEQGVQRARHPEQQRQIAAAIPLGATGNADDVAAAVLWLASEEARYVSGITLRVDGGLNLPMARASIDGVLRFI